MHDPKLFATLRFKEAAKDYLASRKDQMRPRSLRQLAQDLNQAGKFFGDLRLNEIHIGHIKEYQEARRDNKDGAWTRQPKKPAETPDAIAKLHARHKANGSIINHEISALQSVLKRAVTEEGVSLWNRIAPFYKPLKTPPVRPVKVLSDEDDLLYFGVLETIPECSLIHWVTSITENSGAAGKELRTLKRKDVHLDDRIPWIYVREEVAKNEYRERIVVLNQTAAKHMRCCMDRGEALTGSADPEDHVYPLRDRHKQKYDASRPASESWLQKQLKKARKATGLKTATPHMFRHMHITLSMEAGENPELIAKRVGHENINMTRYYTHTREQSQYAAVSRLDPAVRLAGRKKIISITQKSA